jgi:hypothetical protein
MPEPQTGPVRMPDGVMDYIEHGTAPARLAEAETAAATGDPESYERALARHADPTRRTATHTRGRPFMTVLADALGLDDDRSADA